jgi:hypothetical protein
VEDEYLRLRVGFGGGAGPLQSHLIGLKGLAALIVEEVAAVSMNDEHQGVA